MRGYGRTALGSLAGAALAGAIAPFLRPLFAPPKVGVGMLTVTGYPKQWDYAVIALLVLGAFAGGAIASWRASANAATAARRPRFVFATAVIVFIVMLFLHDHPYAFMDHFHEGEHLAAGWLMKSGERPYGDFYIFHGLAADAALDALTLGDPPSPRHVRRLQTVLDALTLGLLVPIAAEVVATTCGLAAAVVATLCACAAFWVPVFPYYRLLPVVLTTLALLRYVRSGGLRPLFLAFASSTLGLLWSLDTGLFALAGTLAVGVAQIVVEQKNRRAWRTFATLAIFAVTAILPIIVLLAVRADLHHFVEDSFVIMPKAIDAVWSLPAPAPLTANGVRYFLPPIFYGFLAAIALLQMRRGNRLLAAQIAVITLFSLLLFRTAAGRVSWSHTRFAMPLLGIALVAFVLEPLFRERKRVAAVLLAIASFVYLEIAPNLAAGAKLVAQWRTRQRHEGLVPYPFATGKGIYTSPENARDLAALNGFIESLGPRDATILDFSNERALYYLLQRKPATRCMEISMLSVPALLSEAMAQLNANPPVCVIVAGDPAIANFDGVSNRDRVPELVRWIDTNYPTRTTIGRFVVASR